MNRTFAAPLLVVVIASTLCGCRTRTAADSGFLPDRLRLEKERGAPFQRVWRKRDIDWAAYRGINVESIRVDRLLEMTWWEAFALVNYDDSQITPTMRRDANRKVARKFARYFEEKIAEAFTDKGTGRVRLVGQAAANTMTLEIAIVELVPVKKYMFVLGFIGDGSLRGGSMAIEGKIKDGVTGETIAMFSDRKVNSRFKGMRPGDELTWYSHAKPLVNDWAKLFVELANDLPAIEAPAEKGLQ